MESFRSKMSQLCSAAEVEQRAGGSFLLVWFLEDLCRGELNL